MTKIFSVDGEIMEPDKPDEVYVALFKRFGAWHVSGVIYRRPHEVESNLFNLGPEKVVIVKVMLPPEKDSD
jgi:hypothetical protein